MVGKEKKLLPIGEDDFRILRASKKETYYVDKTLMIKDFIDYGSKVTLITRPRRFGKTLNMTMLRDFFDIDQSSHEIFKGLKIMDTEYVDQINSVPVVYLSLKECTGESVAELKEAIAEEVRKEYIRYEPRFADIDKTDKRYSRFFETLEMFESRKIEDVLLKHSLSYLVKALHTYYSERPIILIDEYDNPIIEAHQLGFRKEFTIFYATFLTVVLKGNPNLGRALLTGIQRVAKESIFSKLNNIVVYSVLSKHYSPYFGLTSDETTALLADYDLELTDDVKARYDGYLFSDIEMYNPWSILNYANEQELKNYWLKTSTNALLKESVLVANPDFHRTFEKLIKDGEVTIRLNLEASFAELPRTDTLWGLFVNAGYLTVIHKDYELNSFTVRIPNKEIKTEFQEIVSAYTKLSSQILQDMLIALMNGEMDSFLEIYKELVLEATSYHDAKEARLTKMKRNVESLVETDSHNFLAKNEQYGSHDNAYHMLMLGMVMQLKELYEITSNIESGHGRSDIIMKSKEAKRPHIVIEFKQGKSVAELKHEALKQIEKNKYYAGLKGNVLCVGLAHDKKKCQLVHEMITV